MTRKLVALGLVALGLSGCAGALTGSIGQDAANAASQLDQVLPTLVMEKAAALHNLSVGLAAINATPGMVTMTPTVGTTTPVVTATPADPVGPPIVPSPPPPAGGSTPVGTFPTSPVITPP